MHASSNSSQKHGKNASQIMRKGQKLQAAPSNACIKSCPPSFKKPSFYSFHAHMRKTNFPKNMASFWDQIPLQMAKISLKKHFLVIISGKIIKNTKTGLKTHF
jgi:hypothetical protein